MCIRLQRRGFQSTELWCRLAVVASREREADFVQCNVRPQRQRMDQTEGICARNVYAKQYGKIVVHGESSNVVEGGAQCVPGDASSE